MRAAAAKGELIDAYRNPISPTEVKQLADQGRILKKGTPTHAPNHLGT